MTVNVNIVFFVPWNFNFPAVKNSCKNTREDFGLKVAREDGREDFAKFTPVNKKKSAVKNFENNR